MISSACDNQPVGLAFHADIAACAPERAYDSAELLSGLIRDALVQAGLGAADAARPFADLIEPGMTVLVKPNWVLHRNQAAHTEADRGLACLVTHPEFIAAAVSEVLKARPARVILADAPIQSCDFGALVTEPFRQRISEAAAAAGAVAEFVDLRRTVLPLGTPSKAVLTEQRDHSSYLLFDLGADSLLEPISSPAGRFRVTTYDPRKLAQTHRPGRHQYLLCREAFEADLVLSLPKLKLHRKAGLTAALKNLVGFNGNKDYLPHHRQGAAGDGGDCYPKRSLSKRLVEAMLDAANRRLGTASYRFWSYFAFKSLARVAREEEGSLEGGWHGNDTCWRMVLDLNRILVYGRPDASMADTPQRQLWSLTDAIVCGEGEGPLAPSPLAVGAVTFSGSAPAADAVHAGLLKLNRHRIPLIENSFNQFRWPLAADRRQVIARCQGREFSPDEVAWQFGVAARPPKGWAGHVEWEVPV